MIDLGLPPPDMEKSVKIKQKQYSSTMKKRAPNQTDPCCPNT